MNIAKWISKLGNNATSYELLPKDESSETTNPRRQSARGFKRYAYVGIALAILLGSVYLYMSPGIDHEHGNRQQNPHTRFRVITIATSKDEKLCKSVMAAEALGYPTPALVKWEMELDAADPEFGGTHIAKIPGVLDYLNGLGPESDDDVVFLIDGYDLWLQLRPETLLQRYYDLLKHEDEHVRIEFGGATSIRHNLVYNAQKRCWPLEPDDPICVAVPGGAWPEDIFGPNTDKPGPPTENPKKYYHRQRPRWLNAGSFMGQAAALRAMFTRALEKANADPSINHDQGFPSAIFGEQEYVRRYGYDRQSSDSNETTFKPEKGKNYEFGIALDTKQELIISTAWSTTQTEWLRWADRDLARELYESHGTPEKYRRYELPEDITRTPPPSTLPGQQAGDDSDLANSTSAAANALPKTWEDAPLYTHMRTGVVPVAVHHNHKRLGAKAFIQTMWNETWFQPHLRTLLDAQARHATDQVAKFDLDGDGMIHEWSAEHKLRIGGYKGTDHGGEFLGFQGLCSGYERELFRDGGAPWTDPNLPR